MSALMSETSITRTPGRPLLRPPRRRLDRL